MADQALVHLVGLIPDVRISMHGILFKIALTVIKSKVVNNAYCMLLGQPWLVAAKVTHDWGSHVVIINGNGTVRSIQVNFQASPRPKLLEVLVCYNFGKGVTDWQESIYLEFEHDLIPTGDITLLPSTIEDPCIEPFKRALTYHSAIGHIAMDKTLAELKVNG